MLEELLRRQIAQLPPIEDRLGDIRREIAEADEAGEVRPANPFPLGPSVPIWYIVGPGLLVSASRASAYSGKKPGLQGGVRPATGMTAGASRDRKFADSLLEEAVTSQLVSGKANSLLCRENTGNFIAFGRCGANLTSKRPI